MSLSWQVVGIIRWSVRYLWSQITLWFYTEQENNASFTKAWCGIFILRSVKDWNKPLHLICRIKQKQLKAIPVIYDNHHGDLRSLPSIYHSLTLPLIQLYSCPGPFPHVCILSRSSFTSPILYHTTSHKVYCATAHKICARKSNCCLQKIHYSRQVMSNFFQEKSIKKKKPKGVGIWLGSWKPMFSFPVIFNSSNYLSFKILLIFQWTSLLSFTKLLAIVEPSVYNILLIYACHSCWKHTEDCKY